MKDNYQKELLKVLEELKVDEKKGLTTQEVKKRQEKYGINELKQKKKKTIIKMILEQLTDKMIIDCFHFIICSRRNCRRFCYLIYN